MERDYSVGQHVIYVDGYGKAHKALVTQWWYGDSLVQDYLSKYGDPGCNVVYVTDDKLKRDSYGTQIERQTSVIHKSKQPAHGNYYCWPDEL